MSTSALAKNRIDISPSATPEARKEIKLYLQYRERYGEKITPESPLFRTTFNGDLKTNCR